MQTQEMSIVVRLLTQGVAEGASAIQRHLGNVAAYSRQLQNGGAALNAALQVGAAVFGAQQLRHYAAEALQAREAQWQLAQTLRQTGQYSDAWVAQLEDQVAALHELTGVEENQIGQVQRILTSFGLQKADVKDLTRLTLDLAAARGVAVESAAQMIGRGLSGEDVELGRAGIHVDKNLSYGEQIAQMKAQLDRAVGGQAAARFDSQGGIGVMRREWNDFMEDVGKSALVVGDAFGKGFAPALRESGAIMERFAHNLISAEGPSAKIAESLGAVAGYAVPLAGVAAALGGVGVGLKVMAQGFVFLKVASFALFPSIGIIQQMSAAQGVGFLATMRLAGAMQYLQVVGLIGLGAVAGFLAGTFLDSLDIAGANISDWLAAFSTAWYATWYGAGAQLLEFWVRGKGILERFGIYLSTEFVSFWKEMQAGIIEAVTASAQYLNQLPGVSIDVTSLDARRKTLLDEGDRARTAGAERISASHAAEAEKVAAIWSNALPDINRSINNGAYILADAYQRLRGPRTPAAESTEEKEKVKPEEYLSAELKRRAESTKEQIQRLTLEGLDLDARQAALRKQSEEVEKELAARLKILAPLKDAKVEDLARQEAQAKMLEIGRQIADVERQQYQNRAALVDKQFQELEIKRQLIEADPFLASYEKQIKSLPVLEQQNRFLAEQIHLTRGLLDATSDPTTRTLLADRIDSLSQRQADVQKASAEATQLSVFNQFRANMADLRTQFGSTAQQIAKIFSEPVNTAIGSITDNVFALIKSGQTLGTTITNIGQSVIDTFLRMALQAASFAAVMGVVNALTGGAPLAFGGLSLGALSLFAVGGFTGFGQRDEPAGIVHRGEFVFDALSTKRLGVPFLESLRFARPLPGYALGGPVGFSPPAFSDRAVASARSAAGAPPMNLFFPLTESELRRQLREAVGEAYVVSVMERNRHVLGLRS